MRILFVTPLNTGCSKWRAEIPAKYLRRHGHTVDFFDEPRHIECPDLIVFGRTYVKDFLPLYRWAKAKRIRIVYDTDDAIDHVEESNPAHSFSRTRIEQAHFMIEHADAVTTTTPELAEHLRRRNPVVAVIPNSIDPEEWPIQPRTPNGLIRIGWTGGNTHYRDLALAMEGLSELSAKRKFKFIVHGLTTMPSVRDLYRDRLKAHGESFKTTSHGRAVKAFLNASDNLPYEFKPTVKACHYVQSICDLKLDIGIAPLADTAFNRFKSCAKYYEYAMSGAVTLSSNVLPYSAEPLVSCENTVKAWKESVAELLESDLQARWKSQYDWVMTHRNIERNVALWEQVLCADSGTTTRRRLPGRAALVAERRAV